APEQAICHAENRLIFPTVTSGWSLCDPAFFIAQHPALPLANVIHRSLPPTKWNWQNEEQNDEGNQKSRSCCPVTPINKIRNGEHWKGFDRDRNCNQRASQKLPVTAQAEKSTQDEGKQKEARLPEVITGPDKWDDDEIRDNNRRVLNALFRNQPAGKPDAQEPRHGV